MEKIAPLFNITVLEQGPSRGHDRTSGKDREKRRGLGFLHLGAEVEFF